VADQSLVKHQQSCREVKSTVRHRQGYACDCYKINGTLYIHLYSSETLIAINIMYGSILKLQSLLAFKCIILAFVFVFSNLELLVQILICFSIHVTF